jgi:hypothetical protein
MQLRTTALCLALLASGCGDKETDRPAAAPSATAPALPAATQPSMSASASPPAAPPAPPKPPPKPPACPKGMLLVDGRVCVDRWEASLIDRTSGQPLSPYYPPQRKLALKLHDEWDERRLTMGSDEARGTPVPELSAWQRENEPVPVAVSKPGVTPNGYLSGTVAKQACENAGKRLCKYDEWRTACEGERRRQFPYGDKYVQGACNVFRSIHPAGELHDDPSMGHLDPRFNLVREKGDPLLRKTGGTPSCASEWGGEALHDMNGNLDEWVDDEHVKFAGGFFSRSKRDGCQSVVANHARDYLDYSLGVRCCADPDQERPSRPDRARDRSGEAR